MWFQENATVLRNVVHSMNWRRKRKNSRLASSEEVVLLLEGELNIRARMSSITPLAFSTDKKCNWRHSREGIASNKMERSSGGTEICTLQVQYWGNNLSAWQGIPWASRIRHYRQCRGSILRGRERWSRPRMLDLWMKYPASAGVDG